MSADHKSKAEEVESRAEAESEEEKEIRQTPWWKKLSVVIPAVTGLLVATTPIVVLLMPSSSKPDASKQQPIYIVQPVGAATPVPTAEPRRDRRPYMATVSTPAGLYMRSGPNEKTDPIIKLEQGAQVRISNCRTTVYIEEIEGRWCQANYKDEAGSSHRGWMFNAYLVEDAEE